MNAPVRSADRPERLRLSVDNFLLLNDAGVFADYAKTELIDGEIYVMNAQFFPHAHAKSQLLVALAIKLAAIGSDLKAVAEVAVRLNDHTMPEPDIVVSPWSGLGPVPVEVVALIVEVAATTLDTDLGRKAALYAAAGVPEYWVVDLHGRRVLMHACPGDGSYTGQVEVPLGEPLVAATIEGLEVGSGNLVA